ncbi:LamG-like jellyroll fold domain-containing protein [Sphingobacterium kyonggiense]
MKKRRNLLQGIKLFSALTVAITTWSLSSCNKEFANVLPEPSENDTTNVNDGSKRVLYIIMDGVKGSVVEEIAPNNLSLITENSIYSYDGLADNHRNALTYAGAWTSMMTGLDYTVSGVTTEDFAGFNNNTSPSIFTRLKSEKRNLETVSISSSASFNDHLAIDASTKKTLANDEEVKSAAIEQVSNGNASVVLAQFHSAEVAANNDYSRNNDAYVDAINKLDTYIGEILTALNNRKTFHKENWLVVVASSKAGGPSGGPNGSNIFADGSRNTYLAFYNPKFIPVAYEKPNVNALPYSGTTAKYVGAGSNATQSDPNVGNFGSDKDATIRFNIRWDYGSTFYPSFLTKRASFSPGVVGWTFFMEYGGTVGLNFSQSGQGNTQRVHTKYIADNNWHTIAARFYKEGSTRYVAIYVDGVPAPGGPLNITGLGNINTTSPLRLGSIGDGNVNCMIADLAIYDMAIPEADLLSKIKITPITSEVDPYYNRLVGYWPGMEGSGKTLSDVTGKSAPFNLMGAINWASFSDISQNISPAISPSAFRAVPNNVDIPTMIYSWMNIAIPQNWGLMGKFYIPSITLPKD